MHYVNPSGVMVSASMIPHHSYNRIHHHLSHPPATKLPSGLRYFRWLPSVIHPEVMVPSYAPASDPSTLIRYFLTSGGSSEAETPFGKCQHQHNAHCLNNFIVRKQNNAGGRLYSFRKRWPVIRYCPDTACIDKSGTCPMGVNTCLAGMYNHNRSHGSDITFVNGIPPTRIANDCPFHNLPGPCKR